MRPQSPSVAWSRLLNGRVQVSGRERIHLDVMGLDLAGVDGALVHAGPQTVDFTPFKIPPTGAIVDFWYVRSGAVVFDQAGRNQLAAGDLLLASDRSGPIRMHLPEPSQLLHVPVPAARMGLSPSEAAHLRGQTWRGGDGTATLLLSVLAGFCDSVDQLGPSVTAGLGYHLTDLISLAAAQTAAAERESRQRVRSDMLLRIQAFAKQNLHNPALNPSCLARQHNISLRYLQKLFQERGLRAAKWIRRERLARCLADLRDPRKADVSIAMIGRRWGFTTPSYFTRVFREEYAMTPRQARSAYEVEGV
ncbi:helix-turn-helix domain-containing protein [Glycomyces xiaoerkulensis]|uniref:helix-turn-helix domain-containing protein n=1 Tax=Glycomyces xiaoerkulensis TaxID=2038139 RepID=UPI0018E42325|nr:helix-turn-helix domain-containing protein [Glycomyces xiaoerkulensis]